MRISSIDTLMTQPKAIAARRSIFVCKSVAASSESTSASRAVEAAANRNEIARVLGLVQWAIANKIRFTGCRPDIRNGVRGIYSTSDINVGDNLVAVPLQSSLVVRPGERCPFTDFIPQDLWIQLPWYAQMACKLLHERALGSASRFVEYLPALPQRVDLPAMWPPEHVRRLQYPYMEQQILDEQEDWARLYDSLRRHLDRRGLSRADFFWALSCVRSRTFAGPHLPTPAPIKILAGVAGAAAAAAAVAAGAAAEPEGVSLTAQLLPVALAALGVPVLWQTVEARRAVSGEPGTVLYAVCPFIDMFNHDSRAQSECVFAPWQAEFRVAASVSVRRGQQLLISYGNQSNDALLQRYGFVQLNGNPHDRYVVEDMHIRLAQALEWQFAVPADEVTAAFRGLTSPGVSLDQVILTAAGAPKQTLQALAALLALVSERQSQSQSQSRPSPGAIGMLSAEALLAAACTEEERAAISSLEGDEAALAQLGRWEVWKAEAAAATATAAERRAAAADCEARPTIDVADDEMEEALEKGTAATVGGGRGSIDDGVVEVDSAGEVSLEPVLPQVEAKPVLPPLELAAFSGDVERYRTVLLFRIAKKRILQRLTRHEGWS